jgi:hypothetical protein
MFILETTHLSVSLLDLKMPKHYLHSEACSMSQSDGDNIGGFYLGPKLGSIISARQHEIYSGSLDNHPVH